MSVSVETLDEIRGEIDREYGVSPGWSGPITDAYLTGYGKHPDEAAHREQDRRRELVMRGWY